MNQPDAATLAKIIDHHDRVDRPRLARLWRYYRNPMLDATAESYRLGQEAGLPMRLRRRRDEAGPERIIENDIGWRVQTLVDFMFGQAVRVESRAHDAARAATISRFLRAVFQANGGVQFFQDLALLGAVYGFVDVVVRVVEHGRDFRDFRGAGGEEGARGLRPPGFSDAVQRLAPRIRLDVIEPTRAIGLASPGDWRELAAYAVRLTDQTSQRIHLWTDSHQQIWQIGEKNRTSRPDEPTLQLESERINRLGRVPVVHIQNLPQPFAYEGLSDVEPLIPLQDELNTRLSDRAHRVTMQSFKMYLGKGLENFHEHPIGPGQMWSTDNPDASIEAFGGDAASPSEEAHIQEIREALDKASGVTPVAAGVLRGRVGQLSSANALRIVLMGLIAKTQRKRVTYGAGIRQLCELALHAADVHQLLPNQPDERDVRIDWPNPLPEGEAERLNNAKRKIELGVEPAQVLGELGY